MNREIYTEIEYLRDRIKDLIEENFKLSNENNYLKLENKKI